MVFARCSFALADNFFKRFINRKFKRISFERPPAAAILPYDPILKRVILIQQFRVGALRDPASPWIYEIVAGVCGKNEKPEAVAIREAKEEANCDIQAIYHLRDVYVSPGASDEFLSVYIGKIDATNVNGVHGLAHEDEDIRVLNLSLEEAFAMNHRGEIKTVPAVLTLFWLEHHQQSLEALWQPIKPF